jgi:hypothetical protein
MSAGMPTVLRFLFVIPSGFVAACLAAAFALVWPFLGPLPPLEDHLPFWLAAGGAFVLQLVLVGGAAFAPWLLFVGLSELFGLGSLLVHALAGLVGAFATTRVAYGASPPQPIVQTALFAAGLAFALVYWLIAGRGAGRWRRRARPAPGEPAR